MQQFHALALLLPKDILRFVLIVFLHLKNTERIITIPIEDC